jgi:hypothetical protein
MDGCPGQHEGFGALTGCSVLGLGRQRCCQLLHAMRQKITTTHICRARQQNLPLADAVGAKQSALEKCRSLAASCSGLRILATKGATPASRPASHGAIWPRNFNARCDGAL